MKSVKEVIGGVKGFVSEVTLEVRKCDWPNRQELVSSTMVVISSLILLSLFVGISDQILVALLQWIMPK